MRDQKRGGVRSSRTVRPGDEKTGRAVPRKARRHFSRRGEQCGVAQPPQRDKKRRGDPMWASVITDLLARWALGIYFLLMKGETEMMAMLFAVRIVEERTKFDQVPRLLKQDVADILVNDFGMPELVPAEFGGTADAAQ